ncbi:hypothetical protein DFH08DRAFT_711666 [Mycena albidolilacea]|uniref:Uncharacterized protein n=1 Tax=Mycena albidolilacea TaxID=1033008 RepID=A0AAD6ZIE8_9AGAR|nr:hypothetical protein DFH08DRAFT_711666 [Mycena albidolilacea]
MARPSRCAVSSQQAASTRHHPDITNDESGTPDDTNPVPNPPSGRPPSLCVQLLEKEARISDLEAINSGLEADLSRLRTDYDDLRDDHNALLERFRTLSSNHTSLKLLKRKSEDALEDELVKKQKQIRRLERERAVAAERVDKTVCALESQLDGKSREIQCTEHQLTASNAVTMSRDTTITSLHSIIAKKQSALTSTQNELYAAQKRDEYTKWALKAARQAYRDLRIWKPRCDGQYSATARELARTLTHAGCAAEKIEFAVKSCAGAFGINIKGNRFMSAWTVARAVDEGGKYREIQLAREILEAPGFVESSDGTTHRGITIESRHITLLVPSYAPAADDSDKSTWSHCTRFVEVAPALDHTGQTQFEGTCEVAERIADTYSRSLLAAQEKQIMAKNGYWRKKIGESKDHAADGKKEFGLSAVDKKEIVIREMRCEAMDDTDLQTGIIPAGDDGHYGRRFDDCWEAFRGGIKSSRTLELKLGEERFNAPTPAQQCNKCTHLFGGCCCHKDLNVVRYGYRAIQRIYSTHNIPSPVLLTNKANTAIINLGADNPGDSAAVQNAVDSSSAGAIKLLQLIGSLLRHKDGEHGYQDCCTIFLHEWKLNLFDLEEPGKFPDVSNNRYGCYTYAAAEVVCFHGIIQELITEIIDGKAKAGQKNYVEANILKGLNCAATMTELVALALYGVSVSWPYMAAVCGTKDKSINLVSLMPLHRKLPDFCAHIAEDPKILLDPKTPLDKLTIDAQPFRDEFLVESIQQLCSELPNLELVISKMFSGAEEGWLQFTPEFHPGGTFDSLTPEQLAILHIPSTNDCSEGMLGTFHVHMCYHPNSTAHSFTNQTRTEWNNTEAFVKKHCDKAVEKYVMREVRKDAKFWRQWLAKQQENAERGRARLLKAALQKKSAADRLAATILEFDIHKIQDMSSRDLKAQLHVYRDLLKDGVLGKILWKNMATVAVRRELVLEA